MTERSRHDIATDSFGYEGRTTDRNFQQETIEQRAARMRARSLKTGPLGTTPSQEYPIIGPILGGKKPTDTEITTPPPDLLGKPIESTRGK